MRRVPLIRMGVAFGVAVLFAMPIVWMVSTSVTPPGDYVGRTLVLWPEHLTFDHYRALWEKSVWRNGLNSAIVAAGTTIVALALGLPAAYALTRLRMPARLDIGFLIFVLLVKLAPPIVLAIPLYHVLRAFGLLDTLAGLVLVYQVYALPFAIWMLLGFVRDVPYSTEEAAMIDGARLFKRLRTIVLPLMVPGLVSTAVFVAIMSWNEFLYALLFVQSPALFTLPPYVATLITEDETLWGQLAAIGFLASLPVLIVLGVVQRGLTRGFASGTH